MPRSQPFAFALSWMTETFCFNQEIENTKTRVVNGDDWMLPTTDVAMTTLHVVLNVREEMQVSAGQVQIQSLKFCH